MARWLIESRTYFPYGEDSLHCDFCDVIEDAGDLTSDWNGETGNHLSCEAHANVCDMADAAHVLVHDEMSRRHAEKVEAGA